LPKKLDPEKDFEKDYWQANYSEPEEMDGIWNAKDHALYVESLFRLDGVKISSIIDFGFGLGDLLLAFIKVFSPYRYAGIEPSKFAYDKAVKKFRRKGLEQKFFKTQDFVNWCVTNESSKKAYDLGICTSVIQYMNDKDLAYCMKIASQNIRYLYLTGPTDKELDKQIDELEFKDEYAIRRSSKQYKKLISPHFTIISSRVLESNVFFDESNTPFHEFLFRT
jgi:hypothetical protein